MPHFIMDRYKFDVGKVVCMVGQEPKGKKRFFYIKPQGSIAEDGQVLEINGEELAFSMMLGVAIGERTTGDRRSFMRSVLGLGVMFDLHLASGSGDLTTHLRDPRSSGRDGFCTISEFVPMKKVGDPYSLEAYLQVNEEEKLQMSTRDIAVSIEDALQEVSGYLTLYPGDIVGIWLDGTDQRVGPGDLIEGGISGISTLSVRIKDGKDAP